MDKYFAWTDGSLKGKIGESTSGGWSSIILDSCLNVIQELYSGFKNTTNNRMELYAVLETLKYFSEPVNITIVSDSEYVVNTFNNKYYLSWINDEYDIHSNLDLWKQIANASKNHIVKLVWTKGHANDELNKRADFLAQHAARCLNLSEDESYNKSSKSGKPLVSESSAFGSKRINTGQKTGDIVYSLGF